MTRYFLIAALLVASCKTVSEKDARTEAEQKLTSPVLETVRKMAADGITKDNVADKKPETTYSIPRVLKADATGRLYILINVKTGYPASEVEERIRRLDGTISMMQNEFGIVQAWLFYADILTLAETPSVRTIEPVMEPINSR